MTPDDARAGEIRESLRSPETSQPTGLGSKEGDQNGKQSGVHSSHARSASEEADRGGVHVGSGVLDRSGSDPGEQVTDRAGRGLTGSGLRGVDLSRRPDDDARVAEIRARADAATDGPWVLWDENEGTWPPRPLWGIANDAFHNPPNDEDEPWPAFNAYVETGLRTDGEFIAAARSDVPWLLDRLADETARADEAEAAVERVRVLRDRYKRAYAPKDEARLSGVIRDLKRALNGGDRG